MKRVALFVILALQTTGLWSHTPETTRHRLTSQASGITAPAQSSSVTPATTSAITRPPIRIGQTTPSLNAASVIAIDADTATVLYAKNADARRPIASVTKMVTALVILSRHDPGDIITIPKLPTYPVEAETIGLVPGDTFKLEYLLREQ